MKSHLFILAILALGCLWSGCSRNAKSAAVQSTAFQSAPAQAQQMWESAQTSAGNGDYLGAATNLLALEQQGQLSPEQQTALAKSLDLVGNKAFAAAEEGDPRATEAVQRIRQAHRPR